MATDKNFYKKFREVTSTRDVLYDFTKRFDEPTYFSFRLQFGTQADINYNVANEQALYDTMPHPLFNPYGESQINDFSGPLPAFGTSLISNFKSVPTYSAKQYLIDANEPTRAIMMDEFIEKFNTLQYEFPYYFQSIDGLSELLKVDPAKGQKQPNDRKITIKCLEGLDLRMSYLLNLYRKIAWDDIYQRWVLPDMMRYFTLKIYLSEFRTFHKPNIKRTGPESEVGTTPLYLELLDTVLPTWVITCEMCEFDLTDMDFEQLHGLDIGADHSNISVKFGIKIGYITEMQIYPQFKHMFLIDRKLNGKNRTFDTDSTSREDNTIINAKTYQSIAQHRENYDADTFHVSGLPYVKDTNKINTKASGDAAAEANGTLDVNFNSTDPATWTGNAINFGKSFTKNLVNKFVDKGKITPIPGLGVSFTEVRAAIQGKNIIGALGLIRKGIDETVRSFGNAPSSRLEQPIQTDNIMRAFLTELSQSQATDEETKILSGTATLALNDKGVWEKIKDFSLATDLIGPGEENIEKSLEGTDQYSQIAKKQSQERMGSLETSDIPTVLPNAASGTIDNDKIDIGKSSSLLERDITEEISQPLSSARLDQLSQDEIVETVKPSSNLSSKIEGGSPKIDNEPNVKTTTIDVNKVIEHDPTSVMYKKIEGGPLPQPSPSKATNSKLE